MSKVNAAKKFRALFSESAIGHVYSTKILGSRTIGLDRVDSTNFESKVASEIALISKKVLSANYNFTKYKEKLISKGVGKNPRQLSIPTIRDRLTLKIICDYLFCVFPEAKPVLPQEIIVRLREVVDSEAYRSFVKIDLQDFYPSIDHDLLYSKLHRRARLTEFKKLIVSAVENPTVAESNVHKFAVQKKGVAQGLSISNVLAEIFMLDVEGEISKKYPVFFRFVDDIVVLTNSDPVAACNEICSILRSAKLRPHPLDAGGSKTQTGLVENGIDFLGYSIKPKKISIRKNGLTNFESSLVSVFADYKHRLRKAKTPVEKDSALARFRDVLHNPREAVGVRIGMGYKAFFAANSRAIGKKSNAVARPRPRCHRPQGVMQDILRWGLNLKITGCIYKGQRFGWIFYYSQINDLSALRRIDNTVSLLCDRFGIGVPPRPKRALRMS